MTGSRRALMERAGYLESNNRIGRVSETGRLSAPKWAVLDHGYIHWKGGFSSMVKPSPELLDRFSELWKENHLTILEFAKTYGTLRRPLFLSGERHDTDFEAREPLSRWK